MANIGAAIGDFLGFDPTPGFNLGYIKTSSGGPSIQPVIAATGDNPRTPNVNEGAKTSTNDSYKIGANIGSDGNAGTTPVVDTAAAAEAARQAALKQQESSLLDSLNALETVRNNARQASLDQYNKNLAGYSAAEAQDLANYNRQVSQNEANLASDRQAALLSASQSGRGLRSILAALGALGGTGQVLADRAVANAANLDIGDAQDTFGTNVDTLGTAYRETEQEQRQRRADADAALQNEYNAADLARAQGQQSTYETLANLFGLDTTSGANYATKAASLYPSIASASRQSVAKYADPSNLYSDQALENYKAGIKDLTVATAPSASQRTGSNLQVYQGNNRRRDEEVV